MTQTTFYQDGAWCFFADPRALYHEGKHQRTYVGWLTAAGDVMVGCYDHRTDAVETVKLKEQLQKDDHANPALYIDEEGYVTVYYSAHNGTMMYYRKTVRPEDISAWGDEQELPINTEGHHGYTYPNPYYLSEEKQLYLFWRGGNFKPNFSVSRDGGKRWGEVRTLIKGEGARPYVKYVSDGARRIWFAFTDGHPNVEPHNSIYCGYYEAGALYQVDGTKIKEEAALPLDPGEVRKVYDASESGHRAWIWDIALDEGGHPVIVYAAFVTEQDHRYRYARWDGAKWQDGEMTSAGGWFPQTPEGAVERETYYSGGLILHHDDPSVVYLSRPVEGMYEIERWQTEDEGNRWSCETITSGSSLPNVRPVVVRGGQETVLWMQGTYVHFTNYETSLHMHRRR